MVVRRQYAQAGGGAADCGEPKEEGGIGMSVSWEMTEQDFEDVKHLLAAERGAMITVIGL